MMIEQGTIFTPDKKQLLVKEIEDELANLQGALRVRYSSDITDKLKDIFSRLQAYLKELQDMKGVVTPQKTNDILNTVSESKKTRLESDYLFGMKRTTFYVVAATVIVLSAFVYTKYIKK